MIPTALLKAQLPILSRPGLVAAVLREARALQGKVPDVRAALAHSLNVDWNGASQADRDEAILEVEKLIAGIPSKAAPGWAAVLDMTGKKILDETHRESARRYRRIKVDPSFSLRNERAVEGLRNTASIFFAPEYARRGAAFVGRAQGIIAAGLGRGLGRSEIAAELMEAGGDAVAGQAYWETVAAVHVQRARSFAALASYAEAGITAFRIVAVMDERTTDVCFPAGTPVTVPGGTAGIETLCAGDLITGRNGIPRRIRTAFMNAATRWTRIYLEDGRELVATATHPFWFESETGEGWTPAEQVREGGWLRSVRKTGLESPEPDPSLLLSRMLLRSQRSRGLDITDLRGLHTGVPGQDLLRQPGGREILLAVVPGSGQEERTVSGDSPEGLPDLLPDVHDQTRRVGEDQEPLFPGMPKASASLPLRDLRDGSREGRGSDRRPLLLESLLPEVRGGDGPRGLGGDLPYGAGGPVQAGGSVQKVLDRLRPGVSGDSSGDRRELLAPERELAERFRTPLCRLEDPQNRREPHEGWGDSSGEISAHLDRVRVARVESFSTEPRACFNLEIEGDPVYLAHGVLVHNCRHLNGLVMRVDGALRSLERVEEAGSLDQIKQVSPFLEVRDDKLAIPGGRAFDQTGPTLASNLEIEGIGAPPYHYRCRSTLVPILEPDQVPTPAAPKPRGPKKPKKTPEQELNERIDAAAEKAREKLVEDLERKSVLVPGDIPSPVRGLDRRAEGFWGTYDPKRDHDEANAIELSKAMEKAFEKIGKGVIDSSPALAKSWAESISKVKDNGIVQPIDDVLRGTKDLGAREAYPDAKVRAQKKEQFVKDVIAKLKPGKVVSEDEHAPDKARALSSDDVAATERFAQAAFDFWGPLAESAVERMGTFLKLQSGFRPHNMDSAGYFSFSSASDFQHELAHSIEHHVVDARPSYGATAAQNAQMRSYWRQRLDDRQAGPATVIPGYSARETHKRDKWGTNYMGKTYRDGSTEVVSTFAEDVGRPWSSTWKDQVQQDPATVLQFLGWVKAASRGEMIRRAALPPLAPKPTTGGNP